MDERTTSGTGYVTMPQHDNALVGDERESGKVLLLGGVAAGVVSGLIVLLTERQKQESVPMSKLDQARNAIEEAAVKTRVQGKKAEKDAKQKRSRVGKKARKEADETQTKIADLLSAARAEAKDTYQDVQKRAPDVHELAQQFRARADDAADDAKHQGRKLRKQAKNEAGKARGDVSSLVDMLKARAGEAEKMAESYLESSLLPKLKDFEKEAGNFLEAGRERATDKAQELRKDAEKDVIPEARKRAEHLRKRAEEELIPQARESAGKLKVTLGEQADVAAENFEKSSTEAAKKLAEAREAARAQAQEAGQSVKRGGRETRSLLLWLGLAGTIVYQVFLNEDQQKKVRELGMELVGEAKDMYGDMKGDSHSLSA